MDLIKYVAETINVKEKQVSAALDLLKQGATVPFIARYRKEATGNLDEEQIFAIEKEYQYQLNLEERKNDVLRIIETSGKLTDEIKEAVLACTKLKEVEDIYRPYKQKKKTRASEAIRMGLEPLANFMLGFPYKGDINTEASKYLSDEVKDTKSAIKGAQDIIAEKVSDDPKFREKITDSINNYSFIVCKLKKDAKDEKGVYKKYYDYSEKLKYIEDHRIMAINRASKEKIISFSFEYDKEYLYRYCFRGLSRDRDSIVNDLVYDAVVDGLDRLALPSVENEVWSSLFERASNKSIEVFANNLEHLLLQAPVSVDCIMGFDPAFRTGCKLAILDGTGKLLHIDKIFPHEPVKKVVEAEKICLNLIKKYNVSLIAIGNGTASRESEQFVSELVKKNNLDVKYTLVSEAGASVYSASENARSEFPDLHVEERSAVSIARRVLDPLSELIKIDPRSIGVGQYQHDLPTKELDEKLDFTVLKTVNRVGVDLNTASKELLEHISGLNKSSANEIVNYRNENGLFSNRSELKKVNKIGAKAFQQAAGFLRIKDGKEALDMTSIHPESYKLAKNILMEHNGLALGSEELKEALANDDVKALASKYESDVYTVSDIIKNLSEPLRDYRDDYAGPILKSDKLDINNLSIGEKLQGVVRNVVDFGAFVDIGLHDDGLVHKSKISKQRNISPYDYLEVGDIIDVYVIEIDKERNRVSLSLYL
ncbi:MAG: Tex family protein [Solobacterium sp.]|nr:Tex family protein [Solobacterium sp.]